MTVVTALAVSWKPLMNSNPNATISATAKYTLLAIGSPERASQSDATRKPPRDEMSPNPEHTPAVRMPSIILHNMFTVDCDANEQAGGRCPLECGEPSPHCVSAGGRLAFRVADGLRPGIKAAMTRRT